MVVRSDPVYPGYSPANQLAYERFSEQVFEQLYNARAADARAEEHSREVIIALHTSHSNIIVKLRYNLTTEEYGYFFGHTSHRKRGPPATI